MRIFLWVFSLLLPTLAAAQTYEMRTPIPIYVASPAGGQCMVYSSANAYFTNGSCSGSSNFGFNAITTATNTTATMTCGTGCSITVSGSGAINATEIDGLTWPTLISGDCLTNNGTTLSWGVCGGGGGSGTVTSFAFTSGNGFTGTVTNPTTTPALSLAPSFTGLAYSNGSALVAATVGQGLSVSSGTISTSYTPRVVTIATDTIASTDCGNYVKYTDAASVAVTLPQATGSFAGCSVDVVVPAGDGPVTVTPTTSTINGASTLVVNGGKFATITADSGNYDAIGTAVGSVTQTIASGTAALGTTAIASGACATAVTVAASGVLTTDTINAGFNGDPTAITGFTPSTSGMLTIIAYPTAGDVNFKVCNLTSSSVTPGAVTLNWHVVR